MKPQRSNLDIIQSLAAKGDEKRNIAYGSVDNELLQQITEKFAKQPQLNVIECGHNRFQDCNCNQMNDGKTASPEACLPILALTLEELKEKIQDILDDQSHQGTGCTYGLETIFCLCPSMRKHQPIVDAYKQTVEVFNLLLLLHSQKSSQE